MVKFEDAIGQLVDAAKKTAFFTENRERRDTDIISICIPESPAPGSLTRQFQIGTTYIDFRTGIIKNPDGTTEKLSQGAMLPSKNMYLHSITIYSSQDVIVQWQGLGGTPNWGVDADFEKNVTYISFDKLTITTTQISNIRLFVCTNPQSVVTSFKQTTVSTTLQTSVEGDLTEAQTWDVVASLKNNLNRIRNQIIAITGEAWGTVSTSIATIWAKFDATTGHVHSGGANDSPKIPWGNVDKTGSNLNTIATRSHTSLTDIGTNAHTAIDSHIGSTSNPHSVTGDQVLPSQGGNSGKYLTTNATNCSWAAIPAAGASIVTNTYTGDGNNHRAVAHGLGKTPVLVLIYKQSGGYMFMLNSNNIHYTSDTEAGNQGTDAMGATNFYVGSASDVDKTANKSTYDYTFFAIG